MEFKKDIPTEDLIKLIHQLPDADKQLLKSEIEADLRKSKRKRKIVRKAGFLKGLVKTMSKDFDAPLDTIIDKAEEDNANGKMKGARQLRKEIFSWR